ncbi:MAG: tetratricopeptide repeat protein [Gemmatirosa sp.]
MSPRHARRLAVVAALPLSTAACFVTRADVRVLQQDIATVRTESARSDSARVAQLDRVASQLGAVNDSLRAMSVRTARFQGDARDALRGLGEQLIQVQELTGQSQRRLQELRASMEQRAETMGATGGTPGAAPDSTGGPGPNQLYELSLDQFRRGSFATARTGFLDLLRRFPTADVAAEAQFYVAESYASERNAAAADTAYQAVVTRYPQSPRAATALYKRARARQAAGRRTEARPLYEELLRRFPRSDEAELAREALREPASSARPAAPRERP